MRELIRELQITNLKEVVIQQDDKSVIMMSSESTTMKRSKHLCTKLTYIKSMTLTGAVRQEYLNTDDMTADVLSKQLHGDPYYRHVINMLGLDWCEHTNTTIPVLFRKRTHAGDSEQARHVRQKTKK